MTEVLQEYQFAEVIGSEEELRAIIGTPLQRAIDKANESLDEYCRAFIARSPFLLIASFVLLGVFPGWVVRLMERVFSIQTDLFIF